jgi:hypothetical protein
MKSRFFPGPWRVLGLAVGALALVACSRSHGAGGTDGPPSDDGWTGQTNIEAIFEASCSGCHAAQWSSCWDVQESVTSVEGEVASGAMPQSGSLSPSDRSTLLAWLGRGAPCTGTKPAEGGDGGGDGGDLPPLASMAEAR